VTIPSVAAAANVTYYVTMDLEKTDEKSAEFHYFQPAEDFRKTEMPSPHCERNPWVFNLGRGGFTGGTPTSACEFAAARKWLDSDGRRKQWPYKESSFQERDIRSNLSSRPFASLKRSVISANFQARKYCRIRVKSESSGRRRWPTGPSGRRCSCRCRVADRPARTDTTCR
jgi:hypothetical protein